MSPFEVRTPDWIVPWEGEPCTGWLSPEGTLYDCPPWCHSALAGELCRHGNATWTGPFLGGGERLYSLGWLQIGRQSASIRASTGGIFYVRGAALPTSAQATRILAWIEAGTQIVDCTGSPDKRHTLEP